MMTNELKRGLHDGEIVHVMTRGGRSVEAWHNEKGVLLFKAFHKNKVCYAIVDYQENGTKNCRIDYNTEGDEVRRVIYYDD